MARHAHRTALLANGLRSGVAVMCDALRIQTAGGQSGLSHGVGEEQLPAIGIAACWLMGQAKNTPAAAKARASQYVIHVLIQLLRRTPTGVSSTIFSVFMPIF